MAPSPPDPGSPPPRLPYHPPPAAVSTRFALLLRRLLVLHGTRPLQELDAETTLGLLRSCASEEGDRQALRSFTPLISCGFLGLLQGDPSLRRQIAHTIAGQLTVRPEVLVRLAAGIAPLAQVHSEAAIETLALFQAAGPRPARSFPSYRSNLWFGVGTLAAAATAGLVLMASAVRRSLEGSSRLPVPGEVRPSPQDAGSGRIPRR